MPSWLWLARQVLLSVRHVKSNRIAISDEFNHSCAVTTEYYTLHIFIVHNQKSTADSFATTLTSEDYIRCRSLLGVLYPPNQYN